MKIYIKNIFTIVFAVLVIAMFSGCTSTTPYSGDSYQGEASVYGECGDGYAGVGTCGSGGS